MIKIIFHPNVKDRIFILMLYILLLKCISVRQLCSILIANDEENRYILFSDDRNFIILKYMKFSGFFYKYLYLCVNSLIFWILFILSIYVFRIVIFIK